MNFDFDLIASAHHKGDVVETVIFNLAKGTGMEGLHGIKAVNHKLIRPLLFASRKEIENYAVANNISWREDSSNLSIKYSRNKIRHHVVPILEEINPKAQESIYSTTGKIKEAELFLEHNLLRLSKKHVREQRGNTLINIEPLKNIPGFTYVLHKLLRPFGFSYIQSNSIVDSLIGISGKLFYTNTHVLNIDREELIISPIFEGSLTKEIEENMDALTLGDLDISVKSVNRIDYKISESNKILAIDKAKLKFPLKIRNWERGDVFYPLGLKGKKKLSDFMIDAKIPVNLKKKVWVLVSENEIVGILGHRLDERFKITDDTQHVYEISIL
jgi:tRNA(Ile)-lysidine synthase